MDEGSSGGDGGLRMVSYNLRRPVPHLRPTHPDRLARRAEALVATIREARPHVLGVQEELDAHVPLVRRALGDDVLRIGRGRTARGGDERCALYIDARRLQLLDWHQVALSPTPEVAGSRGWGNLIPRVAVVADLRDRRTGRPWTVVNTHLDHLSRRSRLRSAQHLRALLLSRSAGGAGVLLGDLNAGASSSAVRALVRPTEGEPLHDAWATAEVRRTPAWRTRTAYRGPHDGARIDWIMTTAVVRVRTAAVGRDRPGDPAGSDHEPVRVEVVP